MVIGKWLISSRGYGCGCWEIFALYWPGVPLWKTRPCAGALNNVFVFRASELLLNLINVNLVCLMPSY